MKGKVYIANNLKRESMLIDPFVDMGATMSGGEGSRNVSNVLARGRTRMEALKNYHKGIPPTFEEKPQNSEDIIVVNGIKYKKV